MGAMADRLNELKQRAQDEYRETIVAGEILYSMIRRKEATKEEVDFLKRQSIDVLKTMGVLGISIVPMSTIILVGIEKTLKPHGMTLFPKKHDLPKSLMEYRLFLDDERKVEDVYEDPSDFITTRSFEEFKDVIRERGLPTFISFDHDLGADEEGRILPSGYDAAKWLVYDMELDIRGMAYKTHSSNIQTRDQINGLLDNWNKELKNRLQQEVGAIIRSSLNEQEERRLPLIIDVPKDIEAINQVFAENGHSLYLVGGCVRDAVMGKKPKDFDLATDAMPDKVEWMMGKAGYKTLPTGKSFGIINVVTDTDQYEIATFRSDVGDGRRPDSVNFTDMKTDAQRRDLTINALYYDLGTREVIDMVGGLDDIQNGVIRTVGKAEDRFREDRLRILRCIRFAARTGHDVSPDIDAALRQNNSMGDVSAERIRDEFLKGVDSAKSVVRFLEMLDRYELFQHIFPNVVVNTRFIEERNHAVLIAWLLNTNGIDKSGAALQAAKYTAAEVKAVKFLIGLKGLNVQTAYVLKKAQANSGVNEDQMLRFGKYLGIKERILQAFIAFQLTVTGADLEGKVKPGPEMGAAIRDIETKKFDDML